MGYFDAIDSKIDKIQEAGEIERFAGNAFWFSIGSLGVFLHAVIFMIVFWTQFDSLNSLLFGSGASLAGGLGGQTGLMVVIALITIFVLGIGLSVVGLVFCIKAHKAASLIREKSELNGMATSFNLLWIVLDVICIALNIVLISMFIAPNL